MFTTVLNIKKLVNHLNENSNIGVAFSRPIINHKSHICTKICKINTSLWDLHIGALKLRKNIHAIGELMIIRRGLITFIPPIVINDDAFISQIINSKGKEFFFDFNSLVQITSPLKLSDYLSQRTRIYIGHLQLKNMGFSETRPFNRLISQHKFFYIKSVLFGSKNVKNLIYLIPALVIEIHLKIVVKIMFNINYSVYLKWKRIDQESIIP